MSPLTSTTPFIGVDTVETANQTNHTDPACTPCSIAGQDISFGVLRWPEFDNPGRSIKKAGGSLWQSSAMRVETRRNDHTLIVELSGEWRMQSPLPRFDETVIGPTGTEDIRAVSFDTSDLGEWDSSLLAFLIQGRQFCEERGLEYREETLPGNISRLIALSREVPERVTDRKDGNTSFVTRFGEKAIAAYEHFLDLARFTGEFAQSFFALFTGRARMRWRDFWLIVQSNSSGSLPIVTLIAFLVGVIVAFLGAVVLLRFGAEYYVSYLVSYGMLRELGALMTAIIMAGRTGAAFAAELGSMKITEEIDALKTLGISPISFLVVPRVMAVFLMMPLLTVYADMIGIIGGLVVNITFLDISVPRFFVGLLEPVTLSDALLGVFKGAVFGLTVGLSGCLRGLQTGTDAGAVGQAATSAVVTGITLIILTNALIDWGAALIGV
jgi:phospholipid/cholesterol/gamma-HCH transport system permease protein